MALKIMESTRLNITELFGLENAEIVAILVDNSPQRSKDAFFSNRILSDFAYKILYQRKEELSVSDLNSLKSSLEKSEHLLTFLLDGTNFFGEHYLQQTRDEVDQQKHYWLNILKAMIWRSKAQSFDSFSDVSIYAPVVIPIIEWIEANCLDPGRMQGVEEIVVDASAPVFDESSTTFSSSFVGSSEQEERSPHQTFAQTTYGSSELANVTIYSSDQLIQPASAPIIDSALSQNIIPPVSPFLNVLNEKNLPFNKTFLGVFSSVSLASGAVPFPSSLEVNPGSTDHIWSEETTQNITVLVNKCSLSWQGSICQVCHAFRVSRKVSNQNSEQYVLCFDHCPGADVNHWIEAYQRKLIQDFVENQLNYLGKITVRDLVTWEYLEEGMISSDDI